MVDTELPAGDPPPYTFEHAGATITVEEQGDGPRTFVLVHGIGMGRSVFGDLVTHLRAHGRVIAIDQPGYGEAPEPARTLTMERTADLIAAFLCQRGLDRTRGRGEVIVIGHSMGTQVAAELAARHPELVDKVVLAAPTVNVRERTALRQILRLAQDLAVESPRVLAVGAREFLRAGPHLRRKMRAMLSHRPEDAFPRITAPVLVMRGSQDSVSPRVWCAIVLDLIPHVEYAEIEGCGHETMIRDAGPAARRIVEFVTRPVRPLRPAG